MALDVTRVTVLGGSKKRVTTRDRRGVVTERYDVRWRVQLRSGESRMFRQRFDRSVDADGLLRRLQAVGLPASGWHLDDDGRPSDQTVTVASATGKLTVWSALLLYRSATWRGASANGRKAAAFTLRSTARVLKPNAPRAPLAAHAYLDLIAFRGADEPTDASALVEKSEFAAASSAPRISSQAAASSSAGRSSSLISTATTSVVSSPSSAMGGQRPRRAGVGRSCGPYCAGGLSRASPPPT